MLEEHIAIFLRIGEHTKFIPDHSIISEKTLNEDYCCWVVISCRFLFIGCLTLFLEGGGCLNYSLGAIQQCWYYDYTLINTSSFCKSHWEVFVLHPLYVMIFTNMNLQPTDDQNGTNHQATMNSTVPFSFQ
jgi:hypothetical protein